MAIELLKLDPEEDTIEIDAFSIGFDLPESASQLTVIIKDKYPEIIPEVIPPPETIETFTITGAKVTYGRSAGDVSATATLNITGEIISSAGEVITDTSDKLPEFKFRQFYYRLINDNLTLVASAATTPPTLPEWTYPVSEPPDLKKEVLNPVNYRIRILNENGQWRVIYRFDIGTDSDDFATAFFSGNNLLEILIKDENGVELLLCSLEVDVTNGSGNKITQKALVVNIKAENKVFDGNVNAIVSATIDSGLESGDDVTATASSSKFDNMDVGSGKTVTADIAISGADAGKYSFNSTATTIANITQANIIQKALVVNIKAENKVFDGNVNAIVSATIDSGLESGDDVTATASSSKFDNMDVGSGKTVTADIAISGADAGKYSFNSTATTTADIVDVLNKEGESKTPLPGEAVAVPVKTEVSNPAEKPEHAEEDVFSGHSSPITVTSTGTGVSLKNPDVLNQPVKQRKIKSIAIKSKAP